MHLFFSICVCMWHTANIDCGFSQCIFRVRVNLIKLRHAIWIFGLCSRMLVSLNVSFTNHCNNRTTFSSHIQLVASFPHFLLHRWCESTDTLQPNCRHYTETNNNETVHCNFNNITNFVASARGCDYGNTNGDVSSTGDLVNTTRTWDDCGQRNGSGKWQW